MICVSGIMQLAEEILFWFMINKGRTRLKFQKIKFTSSFCVLAASEILCIISSSQIQQSTFCTEGLYEGSKEGSNDDPNEVSNGDLNEIIAYNNMI